jgi:hypothetical protein
VLLIVLGTAFLVTQFMPGVSVAWWALWPLIIVVAGVVQLFTPGSDGWGIDRVFEGLGTIVFGLILLGNTTGYISWSVWWVFITLWPALVIALGLAILGKGLGQAWLRILATLVVWLTLAYAVSASWTGASVAPRPVGVWMRTGGAAFSYSEPVGNAKNATLNLRGGAGEIVVTEGGELVTVRGTSPFGTPSFATKRSGDSAVVDVGLGNPDRGVVVMPGMVGSRMDVRLSGDVLWDALLETGATTLDADLSHVRVRDLEIKTGASSVVVKLGEVPSGTDTSSVLVKAGVSSVTILLPRDAAARVDAKNGLAATDVRGGLQRVGGSWETPGYSSASKAWNIQTEAGIGSVTVDTY